MDKVVFACPQCNGQLVNMPEKRNYYATVRDYTENAKALRAQHQAAYERLTKPHEKKFTNYHFYGCLGLFVVAVVVALVVAPTGEARSIIRVIGVWMVVMGLYAGCVELVRTSTKPKMRPLPPGAEEMEDKQVLESTRSGMMLKCRSCGWEDWAYNYDEAAQQQVAEAKKQTVAAKKAACAAENAAASASSAAASASAAESAARSYRP